MVVVVFFFGSCRSLNVVTYVYNDIFMKKPIYSSLGDLSEN